MLAYPFEGNSIFYCYIEMVLTIAVLPTLTFQVTPFDQLCKFFEGTKIPGLLIRWTPYFAHR